MVAAINPNAPPAILTVQDKRWGLIDHTDPSERELYDKQADPEEAIGLTLKAMRLPLSALGYEIVGELAVTGIFDKGKVSGDTAAMERAEKLGSELARSLKDA